MSQNINVFLDHVGHTIVAEVIDSSDKDLLKVKNPVILVSSPNQNGQLTVQLIPVFFKEFVKQDERENGATFIYNKSKIVQSEVSLDERLLEQYVNMFLPPQKVESKEAPTIKLFDE